MDHFDPHAKEGTKDGKRGPSLLGETRKALKTAAPWSKAQGALARLLGLQEHLAKIVMQDTHREDLRRTPPEVIARARKHVWIPKGTQQARQLLRGEADPKGFSYIEFSDEDPMDRAVLVGVHDIKTAVLEAKRDLPGYLQ